MKKLLAQLITVPQTEVIRNDRYSREKVVELKLTFKTICVHVVSWISIQATYRFRVSPTTIIIYHLKYFILNVHRFRRFSLENSESA